MLSNIMKLNVNSMQLLRNSYRLMASAQTQPSDPIQKLFVDKIREYTQKSKTTTDGLVDANDKVMKGLKDEMERVARSHGIKEDTNLGQLNFKFDAEIQVDPINLSKD